MSDSTELNTDEGIKASPDNGISENGCNEALSKVNDNLQPKLTNDESSSASSRKPTDVDPEEDDVVLFDQIDESLFSTNMVLMELADVKAERDKLRNQLESRSNEEKLKERSFQEIAKELEAKCFSQQEQLDVLQDHLSVQREQSNQTIANLQKELALRVDQVTKMYEDAVKEREVVVSRLAQMDGERRDLIDSKEEANKKIVELNKNFEKLQLQLKTEKNEIVKLHVVTDRQENLVKEKSNELSKIQEEFSSLNIKLKWAQNKLKSETEEHSATKARLQTTTKKLKEACEEGEQLRSELKATVQTYQESEEMKSNTLGVQLKRTEHELKQHEREIADQLRIHEVTCKELEHFKKQLRETDQELQSLKEKCAVVEKQNKERGQAVLELTGTNSKQAEDIGKLKLQLKEGEKAKKEVESVMCQLELKEREVSTLHQTCNELREDIANCKRKEKELLLFTEKLSSSNAELQSQRCSLEQKLSTLVVDSSSQTQYIASLELKNRELEDELLQNKKQFEEKMRETEQRIEDKGRAVEQLSMDLEDARNEVRVQQRRNANNVKDLTKQLHQYRRWVEQIEGDRNGRSTKSPDSQLTPETDGLRSTSKKLSKSYTVLDTIQSSTVAISEAAACMSDDAEEDEVKFSHLSRRKTKASTSDPNQLPIDKSVLIDKICRAQRKLARMEEKMDFYEEHVKQLTEDIKRKSKIIQFYVMREESGTLVPSTVDEHKAAVAKKGGIMASVYQSKRVDSHMTLELSLEINKKLQAVLEDTILKNITLKENLDTLGNEVARLATLLHEQQFQT